jgi:oligoribonuclease (3'-5' exoribonuclease)
MRLLWTDLETSGPNPGIHEILEIAISEATLEDPFNATPIYHAVIHNAHPRLMDAEVKRMHTKNGLLAQCAASTIQLPTVEHELLHLIPFIDDPEERPILAGASVQFDHNFMDHHFRVLRQVFSHRHYDVSAIKLFCRSHGMPAFPKGNNGVHRAQADVEQAIDHARQCSVWVKEHFRNA